jgi:hypothetical protein
MIVRKQQDGQLLLIGQTDHSRLVGQIAAHWGNARFATPKPYDSVVRAATYHDFGWLRYETSPILLDSGETPEFRTLPFSQKQMDGYQWCSDWMTDIDPYSGLIVSMHRTGLWRHRYDTMTHPDNYARGDRPEIAAFVERDEKRQGEARKAFDSDEVWTNYWLLQVWDLLGLYFCCAEPCDDYIDPVPVAYGSTKSDGIRLTLKALGPDKVKFDPYPFDRPGIRLQLGSKRLPQTKYADQASFRRAYFQAPIDLIEFEAV